MKSTRIYLLTLTMLTLFLAGCAAIPPQAPELSVELGNRLSAIEAANVTLLNRFFDHKREAVDTFIVEEWMPVFADEFFAKPGMAEAWNTIVQENDESQRLKFIMMVGTALQKRINQKRLVLMKPLDDLERYLEKAIRTDYNQARALNNSITSFLVSASDVTENRDRYLDMIGLTDDRVSRIIDDTDTVVTDLLSGAQTVQAKIEKIEEYLEKLERIKESI